MATKFKIAELHFIKQGYEVEQSKISTHIILTKNSDFINSFENEDQFYYYFLGYRQGIKIKKNRYNLKQ